MFKEIKMNWYLTPDGDLEGVFKTKREALKRFNGVKHKVVKGEGRYVIWEYMDDQERVNILEKRGKK